MSTVTIKSMADLNLKTYTSVTQLGLTAGSATILTAFNALLNNSALYAPSEDFASGEVPGNGVVIIIKNIPARSCVEFRGKAYSDGTHIMRIGPTAYNGQNANAPTGEWVQMWDAKAQIPVASGGTGASSASAARTNLGITPENIGAVIGNGSVTVKRISNTGSRAVTITCTATEQVFLIIGAVSNTANNRVALLTRNQTTGRIYETTIVGSPYNPTISDDVISLVDKRTYEQFIIISNGAFTYTG